jgi:hypothetical protein
MSNRVIPLPHFIGLTALNLGLIWLLSGGGVTSSSWGRYIAYAAVAVPALVATTVKNRGRDRVFAWLAALQVLAGTFFVPPLQQRVWVFDAGFPVAWVLGPVLLLTGLLIGHAVWGGMD